MNKQLPKKKDEQLPAYLTQGPALGTENIDMADVIIPRLKIVQGQTTAKANNKQLIDGGFYHSVSEQLITKPDEALDLFFLLKWNSRIIFDENLKFVASEYTDYNTKDKIHLGEAVDDNDPRWMDCINYFVVLRDKLIEGIKMRVMPEVLIYTAMSGSMKPAKKLNSFIKEAGQRGISMFAHRIQATTQLIKFPKGSAYIPVFTPKGFASEKEHVGLAQLYKSCKDLASTEAAQREEEKETPTTPSQSDTDFDFDE